MTRTGTYRYVVWSRLDRYIAAGWIIGAPASEHSCFVWACACNQEGREP